MLALQTLYSRDMPFHAGVEMVRSLLTGLGPGNVEHLDAVLSSLQDALEVIQKAL